MRSRLARVSVTLALFVGAVIGGDASAGLPMTRWHGENWHPFLLYNMNPRHPNPALGRLLGRTKALDRWQVPPPIGAQRLPVSVYTLPHVDRHVAVYVVGGHVGRALLVQRGWRIRPHTLLSRIMNYTGTVAG